MFARGPHERESESEAAHSHLRHRRRHSRQHFDLQRVGGQRSVQIAEPRCMWAAKQGHKRTRPSSRPASWLSSVHLRVCVVADMLQSDRTRLVPQHGRMAVLVALESMKLRHVTYSLRNVFHPHQAV